MFTTLSRQKAVYNKGQVFPFLIAVVVIVVIITMITVNLGQISLFKTDASNAADAAALSAASTLSAALLKLGLKSDMMMGYWYVCFLGIIGAFCSGLWFVAVAIYTAYIVHMFTLYFQAVSESRMAWATAKKTAFLYAFQNAGIDEPRAGFNEFVKQVYGLDPESIPAAQLNDYYDIYVKGDDDRQGISNEMRNKIRKYSQSGFSAFMERQAYWKWGEITPRIISREFLTSGYGWGREGKYNPGHIIYNSYNNPYQGVDHNYRKYDNFVEVEIIADVGYPLVFWHPFEGIRRAMDKTGDKIVDKIKIELDNINLEAILKIYIMQSLGLQWWLLWCVDLYWGIIKEIGKMFSCFFPGGLKMKGEIADATDNNPITVTVRRFKKENADIGLWKFRYGKRAYPIEASASSHAYRETGVEDIKPCLYNLDFIESINRLFDGEDISDLFYTAIHLFETELIQVR